MIYYTHVALFYWKNKRNYVVEKTDVHIENGQDAKVPRLLCGYLVIGIYSLIQWLGKSQSRSLMQFSWDRWQFESITIAKIKVTIVSKLFLSIANAPFILWPISISQKNKNSVAIERHFYVLFFNSLFLRTTARVCSITWRYYWH